MHESIKIKKILPVMEGSFMFQMISVEFSCDCLNILFVLYYCFN